MTTVEETILTSASNFSALVTWDETIYSTYAYKGFDPRIVIDKMNKAQKNHDELMKDLKEIIFIFLTRGTNIDQIKKRSNEQAVKKLSALQSRYKLVGSLKNQPHGAVNLARIASAYPILTAAVLYMVPSESLTRPVSMEDMAELSAGFPKLLMFTGIASLIPSTTAWLSQAERDCVLRAIALYGYSESKVISDTSGKSDSTLAKEAWKYVLLAHQSELIAEAHRTNFCRSTSFSSVITTDGKATEAVWAAARVFHSLSPSS